MCNCDKNKCLAICHYCCHYEDSYIDGDFSGVGECKKCGNQTDVTKKCDSFKCHSELK